MNKRKQVAAHKHRVKAKKRDEKRRALAGPSRPIARPVAAPARAAAAAVAEPAAPPARRTRRRPATAAEEPAQES